MKPYYLIVIVALSLTACGGGDHQDLRDWMSKQSAGMRGRVPPLPQVKTFPIVDYDNGSLIEPFNSSKLEPDKGKGGKNAPDPNRRKEPLESYPLEMLKMVGMMIKNGQPLALIQVDKVIYQVKVGNYLGQSFGMVTKITDGEVTLKELVEDSSGDWEERMSSIQLQEQESKK